MSSSRQKGAFKKMQSHQTVNASGGLSVNNLDQKRKTKIIVQLMKLRNNIEGHQKIIKSNQENSQLSKSKDGFLKGESLTTDKKGITIRTSRDLQEKEMDQIIQDVEGAAELQTKRASIMTFTQKQLTAKRHSIFQTEDRDSIQQLRINEDLVKKRKSSEQQKAPSNRSVQKKPNKENMDYLNQIYHEGKKKKGNETIEEKVDEDEEANQLKEVNSENLSLWGKVRQKLSWLNCKKKSQSEEDEDDYKIDIVYSSGESDDECQTRYEQMTPDEKITRIEELWKNTNNKAKGAAMLLNRFGDLNRRLYLYGKRDLIMQQKNINSYQNGGYTKICCLKFKSNSSGLYQEEIKPLPIILMPDSKLKTFWNLVVALLLIYTATFVPYRTAFIDDGSTFLQDCENFLDSLFIVDLFVNFLSAYEDQDKNIEVRLKYIAKTYLKSWFLLDVVACIPFQLIEQAQLSASGGSSSTSPNIKKLLKLARLPRLYRLLRILRLFKMFRLLKGNKAFKKLFDIMRMNTGVVRLLKIALTVLVLVHLTSCMWYLQAKFLGFTPNSWPVAMGYVDKSNSYLYLSSCYWALQTLTTVGYGDIHPQNDIERLFALIWMIIGIGYYSFTMGNLTSIINAIDVKAAHLQQKLNTLQDFSKRNKLPEDVQARIRRFLELNHTEHLYLFDQQSLLNQLPSSLRANVVIHTHGEIIRRIKFFEDKEPDFLWSILPLLKPMRVFKQDILYKQGDHAEEIFFMLKGKIKLLYDISQGKGKPQLIPFNMHYEGEYFGDTDVLLHQCRNMRLGTAVADTECQLLIITKKELLDLLKRYREVKLEMKRTASERLEDMENTLREIMAQHRQKRKSVIEVNELHKEEEEFQLIQDNQDEAQAFMEKRFNLEEASVTNISDEKTSKMGGGGEGEGRNYLKQEMEERVDEETDSLRSSSKQDSSSEDFESEKSSKKQKGGMKDHVNSQEQLLNSFVDNMSMMALNAYEILKYYDNIVKEYQGINEKIRGLDEQNQMIEEKSLILEGKIIEIMDLL